MSVPCHEGPPATKGHFSSEPAVAGRGRYYCTTYILFWQCEMRTGDGKKKYVHGRNERKKDVLQGVNIEGCYLRGLNKKSSRELTQTTVFFSFLRVPSDTTNESNGVEQK